MGFRFNQLSVLVVEDTEPMRKLVRSILQTLGVGRIYTAGEGETGFDRFCKDRPDIVMTDWHMEPADGISLVDKIRHDDLSHSKTTPVIMMSGYSALPRVAEARDAGVTEFLVKPFSANDLARRIAYVINKPRNFIETPDYFGPDRRRRSIKNFEGQKKRAVDKDAFFV